MAASFTSREILDRLEDLHFPVLDNGYWYPVGARLSAYRSDRHWAMIFEKLAYNPRAGEHTGIHLVVSPFGNCLVRRSIRQQADYLNITGDGPEGPTFIPEGPFVSDGAQTIRVREQLLPVATDLAVYERENIPLEDAPQINPQDLLRLLYPRFQRLFHATEAEIRRRLSEDIPLGLRTYSWQHPHVVERERPSQSPSLVAIAEMLESGRVFDFVDPGIDNIHWRNWPEGGSL